MGVVFNFPVRVFLLDTVRIMMPNRAFASCMSFGAGMLLSGFFDLQIAVLGSLMILCTYCSQAIFNNLRDMEGDVVNAPDRPLVNGTITEAFAWRLMYTLILMGFVFAYLASPFLIIVNTLYVFIGIIYSSYTKAKWYLSYLTLATSHIITPLVSGYLIFGAIDERIIIIAAFLYLTEMLVWSIKDYKDVKGDAETGVMTLPVVMSPKKASYVTCMALALPLLLVWMPWHALQLSNSFLMIYLAAGAARLFLGTRLLNNQSPAIAAGILKNFRYVLFLQMIGWCLS